jgi:hypothetical protein
VRPLVAVSLADALCTLVGPLVALVDDLERGPADASTLAAVLQVSLDAYQANAAAGLALVYAETSQARPRWRPSNSPRGGGSNGWSYAVLITVREIAYSNGSGVA